MPRDPQQFPDDDNGNTLWRMHEQGDDLSQPREIDFSVVFATEDDALRFAVRFLTQGFKVQVGQYEDQPDGMPWDVSVFLDMAPVHADIGEFEAVLEEQAVELGGKLDGWGCYAVPRSH